MSPSERHRRAAISPLDLVRLEMMDRALDRTLGRMWRGQGEGSGEGFEGSLETPLDVSETEQEYLVQLELPGVDPDDIDVSMTGETLTIAGEKKHEHEDGGHGYQRRERRYGAFRRDVVLPGPVDPGGIEARQKNGVLTVRIPKSEHERPRRIRIEGAETRRERS